MSFTSANSKAQAQLFNLNLRKYELPANTCPIIDAAISKLEAIRTANDTLRTAATAYYRDNKELLSVANTLSEENDKLVTSNTSLQLTRDWIASTTTNASIDAQELVQLKIELAELQDIRNVLSDVLRVTYPSHLRSSINRKLKTSTISWLEDNIEKEKQLLRAQRVAAQAKLSTDELQLLGIKPIEDDDEEDEEEDD